MMEHDFSNSKKRILELASEIRAVEHSLLDAFSKGSVRGTVHTSLGQEIIAATLNEHLEEGDLVFGTHRSHAHYLSRTGDKSGLIREILGKVGATSAGLGGSQHLSGKGIFTNGIQGGMLPIAVGAAHEKTDSITVALLGDGTLGQGIVYETLNIASKRSARTVFLLENNHVAQSTPYDLYAPYDIRSVVLGFGIKYFFCDSRNLENLFDVLGQAVETARKDGTPVFVEVMAYRMGSHSKGDDNRPSNLIAEIQEHDYLNKMIKSSQDLRAHYGQALKDAKSLVELALNDEPATSTFNDFRKELLKKGVGKKFDDLEPEEMVGSNLVNLRLKYALDSSPKTLLIGEDIETLPAGMGKPYGGAFGTTKNLSETFPSRVISFPIAEASLTGYGVGHSLTGCPTVVEIMFSDFSTIALDQIRQQASKMVAMYGEKVDMPLLLRLPVGGRRGYGPTHSQNMETIFFGLPNVIVFSMCPISSGLAIYAELLDLGVPVIAIEPKDFYVEKLPVKVPRGYELATPNSEFKNSLSPNNIRVPHLKPNLTVIAYGMASKLVLGEMEELLFQHEVLIDFFSFQIISPFDATVITSSIASTGKLLIVEEGLEGQGWISEVISSLPIEIRNKVAIYNLGGHGEIGASMASEKSALISGDEILSYILKIMEQKK